MINIRTLRKIPDNGDLTLKNGKPITYKTGYQVATEGYETSDIHQVRQYIKMFDGNAGLWLSGGVWYIDKSHRVSTKRQALSEGREHNQQSVFKWNDSSLVWC